MYLNFLFLPILLLIIIGLFGRYIGLKGVKSLINQSFLILIVTVISLLIEYFKEGRNLEIIICKGINIDLFKVEYIFYLDELSQLMLLIIISITYIVLIYSYDYMITDPHIIRFYFYIILFIFFMIILITTSSLPILFIGWEGVGLSSFLLISFWYNRFQTQLGAILAIIMNRIGDIFYIMGILLSLSWLGSMDILSLNSNYLFNLDYLLFTFFLASMAKSAQLYLHLWLPFSMEGPTPISALIHAATMVTAGIFLLLRLNFLLAFSYYILIFITIIGTLTAFIGGTLALISLDIKELIAYSTMSQLGYMITILGLKFNNISFFHLIFHAYFKALLFLTAGSIIHTILDLQDFRKTGALIRFLPFTSIITIIGSFSLIAFPFTTGFYSKEQIINNAYIMNNLLSHYSYIILFIGALITIFYSYRFFFIIFLNDIKLSIFSLKNLHYFSLYLFIPLFILGFITIVFGFFLSKWIHLFNSLYFNSYSFDIPLFIKILPLFFIIFILLFQLVFISYSNINLSFILSIYSSFKLIYLFISGLIYTLSYRIFFKLFDYGFFDLLTSITGSYFFLFSKEHSKIINNEQHNNYLSLLLFFIFICCSI